MSYRNKTYVIFDGDKDIWAYGRMKGWKALPTVDFNFSRRIEYDQQRPHGSRYRIHD